MELKRNQIESWRRSTCNFVPPFQRLIHRKQTWGGSSFLIQDSHWKMCTIKFRVKPLLDGARVLHACSVLDAPLLWGDAPDPDP